MKRFFKNFLKEYFNFSKRERNGIFVILLILTCIIVARVYVNNFQEQQISDFSKFDKEVNEFLAYSLPDLESGQRFSFDPNTVSCDELLYMGLSKKTVDGIIAYREKGYKFYKAEDLKRVYKMTDEEYEAIKDYVEIKTSYNKYFKPYVKKQSVYKPNFELFEFDPNTATYSELKKLGFKSNQINNIINYREKGNKYSTTEDLLKLYTIDTLTYQRVERYVKIESNEHKGIINSNNESITVFINSADTLSFQRLKGIGSVLSKRILAYRSKLGGFISIEQISEVYGISDELFGSIRESLVLDNEEIKKINLNKCDFKELISHPYINKEVANSILNYRSFKGNIENLEELVSQKALKQSELDKILPYVTL